MTDSRITVATMAISRLPNMAAIVGSLLQGSQPKEFIFIDNGSGEILESFVYEELASAWRPICSRPVYLRNEANIGVTAGWQQVLDHSETDIVALFHNDLRIEDPDWDNQVLGAFDADPLLALVTFFGCPGVMSTGERGGVFKGVWDGLSNMSNAEQHGMRITKPRAIAVADSFSLILRRSMVEEMGGFDVRFIPDHFYDYHLALQFLARGYHNLILPIRCTHAINRSRHLPSYAPWVRQTTGMNDEDLMWSHLVLLRSIWGAYIPLYVNEDFSIQARDPLLGAVAQRKILAFDGGPRFPIKPPAAEAAIPNTVTAKQPIWRSRDLITVPNIVNSRPHVQRHQVIQSSQVIRRWE